MDRIRLLYIEDDETERRQSAELLRDRGFDVSTAQDGLAGLEILEQRSFDVVLCDLNMPRMNGLEVLRRSREIATHIPFLILTAHGSLSLAVETIREGALHFILKPFAIEELEIKIHQSIEIARMQQTLRVHSLELEKQVDERTERLTYMNQQLTSLNRLTEDLTKISDEEELLERIPEYLTATLDFDRAACFLARDGNLRLRSFCFKRDPQKAKDKFEKLVTAEGARLPADFVTSLTENRTVLVRDPLADPEWSEVPDGLKGASTIIITPIRVGGRPIGIISSNMKHQERELDEQDIARVEMFARIVGLAIDDISFRQSQERTIAERTKSLRDANTELDNKAKLLEAKTMELAQANVDLLGAQEQIEQDRDVLQAIIDSSPSALVMVNQENRITAANRRISEFFGLNVDAVLGTELNQFHHQIGPLFEDTQAFADMTDRLKQTPDGREPDSVSMANLRERVVALAKPNLRMITVICTPVLERGGEELGRVWNYYDITDEVRADEQIRLIVESSPIPTIISRLDDGKIIFANEQLGRLVGYRKEELIGKYTPDFYYDREQRQAVVEGLRRDGYLRDYEVRIKTSDGGYVWTEFSLTITRLGGEAVILGGIANITERKRAEEELKRERNFVSAVLDTAGALVVVLDREGHILRFNAACERISGYSFDEVRGEPFADIFILPEEADMVQERFRKILTEKGFVQGDNYWRTKDGSARLIAWSNTVLLDDTGEIEYVIATGIDITQRKEAEESLKLYKEIFLNSKDGILIVDPAGNFIEANPTYSELYGYSAEELRNLNVCAEAGTELEERFHRAFTTEGSFRGTLTSKTKEGEERTVDISAYPIRNESGDVTRYISVERDVTARKQAEDALALRLQYEEELAKISQELLTGREAVDALDLTVKRLLSVSKVSRVRIIENFDDPVEGLCMRQTYGACTPDLQSLLASHLLQHIRYDDGLERWKKRLSKGEEVRGSVESFPESERKIISSLGIRSVLAIPIEVEGKWYGFVELDDCKEGTTWSDEDTRLLRTAAEIIGAYVGHQRFEQALRMSEERFRSLVENATDIIFSLDPEGKATYLSPQFTEVLGYPVSEFLGRPPTDLMPPEDAREFRRWSLDGMPQDHEHRGGYQFRMRTKAGHWRWFISDSSIIRDDDGKVIEAIGVAHDITEVRQMLEDLERANKELRDTQTQLVQSEKMASLGQLVAGIAHEINTPVGAVSSMHDTQLRAIDKVKKTLESEFPAAYAANKNLQACFQTIESANKVIESGTERVTTIVRRLRSFARLDEAELKTVDIHEGLEDTLTLIHHEIKHHIKVKKEFGNIPPIACYPGRVNQVFLNILNNARQAVTEKGEIRIRTYRRGRNVCIEISDNGHGISKDHLPRVFDPGFTTKGVGVGTGLGLSICYQIIQDHRGDIEVESEPGKGTTFRIVLPIGLDEMIESNG